MGLTSRGLELCVSLPFLATGLLFFIAKCTLTPVLSFSFFLPTAQMFGPIRKKQGPFSGSVLFVETLL